MTATLTSVGGLTGATLASDGTISVPATATPGDYTLTYKICQVANPGLCDPASVQIRVIAAAAPTTAPAVTSAGGGASTVTGAALAATGSDTVSPLLLALGLLLAGTASLLLRRRRSA